ncbi:MAG: TolC family protein [Muribaculaceae bacterium]|nr:TolC family protein [Muribaculaceae bacterium]
MNNLRLLTGLFAFALLSTGVWADAQTVISLEDIFKTAESQSAQLRPALTAIEEARREVSVSRSKRLPDISASLSVSYISDGFTTKRDFSDYQAAPIPHLGTGFGVNINQPLYTGGAITSSIKLAELKTSAARFAADFQRDNIRFQLTGFYLDLYKYSNLRTVIDGNLITARKLLSEMNARYAQGTALRNDITRYELLIANLELEQTRIANMLEILNNNLISIAGLPDGTTVIPDSTILAKALPLENEQWWLQEAESNSPRLKLARSVVNISRQAEKLTKAERLPSFGLHAGWTMDGPILVEIPPIDRNLSYWYVGLGVSYNISSLFKTNKALARNRATTQRAIEELDAKAQELSLAVRADNLHYLEAYEELRTQEKSVELANRNYRTTSTRYLADMALITDMLDAANSKLDAEQQLVNARINIIYYYYKLLFTSGKI